MIGTRSHLKLLTVASALVIGVACTNSGLADQVGLEDSGATGTNPTGGNTGPTSCALAGNWTVSKAWCGTFEIDTDWFAVYPTTEMSITDSGAGDGSCSVAFSWSNAQCAEEEDWAITGSTADTVTIQHDGIATCAPAACTFFGSDDTCSEGDRSSAEAIDYGLETLQATQIRITGLLAEGYPQCTLDLTTEWVQQ